MLLDKRSLAGELHVTLMDKRELLLFILHKLTHLDKV
jgi:hypothetical protein